MYKKKTYYEKLSEKNKITFSKLVNEARKNNLESEVIFAFELDYTEEMDEQEIINLLEESLIEWGII